MKLTFKEAVEATPEIADAWNAGLRALREVDRNRLDVQTTQRLRGSVELDSNLRAQYPNETRWDYGVAYQPTTHGVIVHWIEVHPANSSQVDVVLRKLNWLQLWLADKATELQRFSKRYVWISTGKTNLTPSAPQRKRLAQAGLVQTGRRYRIA